MKKKKRFGTTGGVLVLTIAVVAYAYFFEFKKGRETEERKLKESMVLNIDKSNLTRLDLIRQNGNVTLEKEDGVWQITSPIEDLADREKVESLIQSLASERSTEVVAEGRELNLATYGLEKPITRLIATTRDGKAVEVKIGAIKSFDAQLYAQLGTENRVRLVAASWDVHLTTRLNSLRDKHLVRLSTFDPDELTIEKRPDPTVTLIKIDGKWSVAKGGDPKLGINPESVATYLRRVKDAVGDDFVSENGTADQVKFGFAKPILKIELKAAGMPLVNLLANDKDMMISSLRPAIFQMKTEVVEGLRHSATSFYDKKTPFLLETAEVTAIDLSKDGSTFSLRKENGTWVFATQVAGRTLDPAKINSLLEQIASLEVDRYLAQTQGLGSKAAKNRIVFSNTKNEKLLQIDWGEVYTGKETAPGSEKLFFAKTNKVEQTFLLSESKIEDFQLEHFLKSNESEGNAEARKSETK